MNPIDFITDLANPQLAFLSRALLVAMICAIINGVVGTHVVLRGMGFVGDALAHAVFPGIAVAFALGASVLIGGALAGLIVTLLITFFSQNRRINEDSVIGIFFASAFALGLVIMSRVPGYTGSLESVLFGSLTGVQNSDLVSIAFGSLILLAVLTLAHRKIVAVSLDRTYAQAMGMKVGALDLVLYLTVAAAVVMSVQIVGNILVVALLLTPAASARLVTDRLFAMMLISPAIGVLSAFFGIWMSWAADLPAGAAIVLVLMLVFVLVAGVSALRGRMRLLKAARA